MIEPTLLRLSKSTFRSISARGEATAGRAAGLDRLELLAPRHAAADLVDDLPQRGAHGHLDQAGVLDLPDQGEDLGAAAIRGAQSPEPVGPKIDHHGDVGEGLDIVDDRGLAPQAAIGRIGRPNAGLPPLALDRMDEGCFLAADERPGAQPDLQIEIETRTEDVLAQQAATAALPDGGRIRSIASGYSART